MTSGDGQTGDGAAGPAPDRVIGGVIDRAIDRAPGDLRTGLVEHFDRVISEADILAFANNSGDHNPLHVDAEYAAGTKLGGRIAHGAFQVGLVSTLVGMYLPGKRALLGGLSARFVAPLYFPCTVRVRGEITAWSAASATGQLKVVISDLDKGLPVSEISVSFALHEARDDRPPAATGAAGARKLSDPDDADTATAVAHPPDSATDRPWVLVTGASGGLGQPLVRDLLADYRVIAMVHSRPVPDDLINQAGCVELRAGLDDAGWQGALTEVLAGAPLYGVVHAAWPSAPRGGLLDAPAEVIERQLAFAAHHTIALARALFERVGADGGRMIALGSTVGSHRPNLAMAAYSLGKGALEDAVRLLAPELARKQITINTVCPSFVPVGINQQAGARQLKHAAARIPMARLCSPDDVSAAVRYLLSPDASFVSGQIIALTGAEL
ncbi:MAG: SDR family oxidoreductase [Myxococcota bacterium]